MRLDDLDEGPANFLRNVGAGIKAGVAGYQAAKQANVQPTVGVSTPGQGMFNQRKEFYAQQRAQQAQAKGQGQPAQAAQPQSQTQYGFMKPTSVSAKMGAAPGQEPAKPAGSTATAQWGGGGQLTYSTSLGTKDATQGAAQPAAGQPAATTAAPGTKPRMNIGRAATGPGPEAGKPGEKPAAAAQAQAAPAADVASLQKTISGLSKREQQKLLTQLLSNLGTPVSAG